MNYCCFVEIFCKLILFIIINFLNDLLVIQVIKFMFIILINIKEVGDWFMRINIYYDEVFVKYEIFLNRNKS